MRVYTVVREAEDGSRWEGRAEVTAEGSGFRVVETGQWTKPDGQQFAGRMEMQIGEGLLRVVQPYEVHDYTVRSSGDAAWAFEGDYVCGDDHYRVWGHLPDENGWNMRFEVAGPKKDGWQNATYVRTLAA